MCLTPAVCGAGGSSSPCFLGSSDVCRWKEAGAEPSQPHHSLSLHPEASRKGAPRAEMRLQEDSHPKKPRMSLFLQSWGRQPLSQGRTWSRCVSFLKSPRSVGIIVPEKGPLSLRVGSSEGLSLALAQDHDPKPSCLWEDMPLSPPQVQDARDPARVLHSRQSPGEHVCLVTPASERTKPAPPQCSGPNQSRVSMYSSPDSLCAARTPAPPH